MYAIFSLPNLLSIIRIILTPLFIYFFFGNLWMQLLSLIIFTVAALTDTYDGYFARRCKLSTKFGLILDPIADKVLIISAFAVFAYINMIGWWIVCVFLIRDLFVISLRIKMLYEGSCLITSKLAKYKTIFQFIAVYLLFANMFLHKFIGELPKMHKRFGLFKLPLFGDKPTGFFVKAAVLKPLKTTLSQYLSVIDLIIRIFIYFVVIFAVYTGIDYALQFYKSVLRKDDKENRFPKV